MKLEFTKSIFYLAFAAGQIIGIVSKTFVGIDALRTGADLFADIFGQLIEIGTCFGVFGEQCFKG